MEHTIHKPDHDRDGAKQAHSSYWKFAHRDWRFWAGFLVFNFYPLTAVMIVMLALLNDGAILSINFAVVSLAIPAKRNFLLGFDRDVGTPVRKSERVCRPKGVFHRAWDDVAPMTDLVPQSTL